MTSGKVVLVPFPFDDLSAAKVRPAICLTDPMGPHRHVVLAFISSQVPAMLYPTDLLLNPGNVEFAATGLRVASVLRLHRLMTLTTSLIQRQLGELSPAWRAQVDDRLIKLFQLNASARNPTAKT